MSAQDAVEGRKVEGRTLLAPDCTRLAPAAAAAESFRTERNAEFLSGADDVGSLSVTDNSSCSDAGLCVSASCC